VLAGTKREALPSSSNKRNDSSSVKSTRRRDFALEDSDDRSALDIGSDRMPQHYSGRSKKASASSRR
jgi:hypothetical protein